LLYFRRVLWVFLLICSLSFSAQAAQRRVLITAFEPFRHEETNPTMEVAKRVANASVWRDLDIDVSVVVLPVVFEKASAKAIAAIEALPTSPEIVLSLGEDTFPGYDSEEECGITMHSTARNLDDADNPDNEGNTPKDHVIVPGAPDRLPLNLFVPEFTKHVPKSEEAPLWLAPLDDQGGYVCNNTAFELANYLKNTTTKYGFMHVPALGCHWPDQLVADRVIDVLATAVLMSSGQIPLASEQH
jgi:pyroglutamyl-peptidase